MEIWFGIIEFRLPDKDRSEDQNIQQNLSSSRSIRNHVLNWSFVNTNMYYSLCLYML